MAKQKTGEPNKEDLLSSKINKSKIQFKRLIITNLNYNFSFIFIWVYYQPQMITTKIGIILTILAM
jgi:hypothetical protein